MLLTTERKLTIARLISYFLGLGMSLDRSRIVTRKGVKWCLDLRDGIDLAIYLFGSFEPQTVRHYKSILKPGDVVIDIGANIGAHTLHLAKAVGEGGHVYAIEPTKYAFEKLCRNLELNQVLARRVTAIQAMLVATPGEELAPELYSSWPLKKQGDAHPIHLGVPRSTAGAAAKSLDEIVKKYIIAKIDLIKLDVDGHELSILRGGEESLRRFRPPMIIEFAPYTLVENGDDPRDLGALLEKLGYRLFDMNNRVVKETEATFGGLPYGASINLVAVPANI